LRIFFIISLFIFSGIFTLGYIFQLIPILRNEPTVIILPGIVLLFILRYLLDKVFNIILVNMKPGDIIKILMEKDEIIVKDVKTTEIKDKYIFSDTIFSNDKVSVAFSKKKIICENYKNQIKYKTKNLYNLAVNYIAIEYLINNETNSEVQDILRMEAIKILEYILAFRNDSIYTLYNLAINELELLNIEKSLDYFKKYNEIEINNLEIIVWINVLEYLKDKTKSSVA